MNKLRKLYRDSLVIVVSNSVNLLTEKVIQKEFILGEKVCGTGCMLDTSRRISEIAKYLKISTNRITAYLVGRHGTESLMIWDIEKVDNKPIEEYCKKNDILWNKDMKAQLQERVTEMGVEDKSVSSRLVYMGNGRIQGVE